VLCAEIRELLGEAFPAVWVVGEVQRVRRSGRGHLYFELIEKGLGDEVAGKLEVVAWSRDAKRIERMLSSSGQEISEGQEIRCLGRIDFYGPFGRLQFVAREVDPTFSLGQLAQRRRETLEALSKRGLLDRNSGLELTEIPLRVALITSPDSAAYHDFLSTLRESPFGFQVLLLPASVQGTAAEVELIAALSSLGRLETDCAVLIRGGGSRTALAVFDSRRVAEAVAQAPTPILTGLGHEIDESVADIVAHTALKTPTKVAEFLVGRADRAEMQLIAVRSALVQRATEPLLKGREALSRARRGVLVARNRLRAAGERIETLSKSVVRMSLIRVGQENKRRRELAGRLRIAAPIALARRRQVPYEVGARIVSAARGRMGAVQATLVGWERLLVQLGPQRTLERGFSITRTESGKILRTSDHTESGDRIVTQLARGRVVSQVEEI